MTTQVWTFADGTGLTFDAAIVQVAGGVGELIANWPANLRLYSRFNNTIDATYSQGVGTGTAMAATIDNTVFQLGDGSVDMTSGANACVHYPAPGANVPATQEFTAEWFFRANYANFPATFMYPFHIANTAAGNDRLEIYHRSATGNLWVVRRDTGGVARNVNFGVWNAPLNTWVHMELNHNTGATRIFINGTLFGVMDVQPCLFTTANMDSLGLGCDRGHAVIGRGHFDSFRLWDGTRHVANFTPPVAEIDGYSVASPTIVADALAVRQLLAFRETVVGNVRYAIRMRGYDWFFSQNHFAWRPSAQAGLQFSCTGAEMTQFIRHFRVMSPLQLVIYLPSDGAITPQVDHIELDYNP